MRGLLFIFLFIFLWCFVVWLFYYFKDKIKEKKLKPIQDKIDKYEPITEEEFNKWREHYNLPFYKTYEEYMQEVNRLPEERKAIKEAAEDLMKELKKDPKFRRPFP